MRSARQSPLWIRTGVPIGVRTRARRAGTVATIALAGVLAGTTGATAAEPAPQPLPPPVTLQATTLNSVVSALVATADGSTWAAEHDPEAVVRLLDGTLTRIALPGADPAAPVTGLAPRGHDSVWFARPAAGVVGWVDDDRSVHQVTLGGEPRWLTPGPAGTVYVVDAAAGTVRRLSAAGAVELTWTVGPISPESTSVVSKGLVTDRTGVLWLLRSTTRTEIGRLDPSGQVSWFGLPVQSRNHPVSLALGPDGLPWGTAQSEAAGVVFRVSPAAQPSVVTSLPSAGVGDLVTGADGNVWTTAVQPTAAGWDSRLLRITGTGRVLERLPIGGPLTPSHADHVTSTPDSVVLSRAGQQTLGRLALPIAQHYIALGGVRSVLAAPRSAEYPIAGGWARAFVGGHIYYSAATRAREVHGAILTKYLALGGDRSVLGLPVSDERPTNVASGRVSHFRAGSVYWSGATGAREVHGAIAARYAQFGGVGSRLGYPTSDEFSPSPGVRQSNFQHGFIRWTPRTGAVVVVAATGYR